jgi:CelD/BcsL family acetyltransferase involved in cellulose biosynthesis
MKGLRTIGSKLWELEDFAYVDALAARQLAKTVLDCNRYVYLHNVASESPTITAFRQEATNHRIVLTRSRPGAPWLQLDTSWKEPESKLNSGRRSDLRRARRHAEKVGRVRLEFKRPTLNELDDLLDVAFQVETANWKGRISSSLSTNRDVGAFYRYYSRLLCEKRCLHLGFMWIGDRAAAMQLAVEHRNCFWLLKMGLDEEYSHTSPGTQLMVESLRYATDLGCEAYEFQGKIEAWNQIWTHTAHSRVSIRIYPPGIRGVCRFIEDGFHYVTRSMHCTEQNI